MEREDKDTNDTVSAESFDVKDAPVFIRDMDALTKYQPTSSNEIGERCFSLLGGRVLFGILFAELNDSFLVALPSTLVNDGHTIEGKLLTASPIIRLMKSGIAFMSIPETEHQYYYFRHIRRLIDVLPGFFTPVRMQMIEDAISAWSDRGKPSRVTSSIDSEDDVESDLSFRVPYDNMTKH